ncbi:hypothetical protein NDU88_000940 [Pleurodeles waltl]|uniref:SWIM-type domain-containing protein n=1 Tax=Pleurodeles waltl TaxID=8319 RepID=A0AAV7MMA2_PLEWA|nr:hypothetical protein NDU88_000940 [Pleurodeles waltl]
MSSCSSSDGCDANIEAAQAISKLGRIFLKHLAEETVKSARKGSSDIEVLPVFGTEEEFIGAYMDRLHAQGHRTFTVQKKTETDVQRLCDGYNTTKETSVISPGKNRPGGCSAYVSFTFHHGANITACVVRKDLHHRRHFTLPVAAKRPPKPLPVVQAIKTTSRSSSEGSVINPEKMQGLSKLGRIFIKNLAEKSIKSTQHGSTDVEVLPVFDSEEEFIQNYIDGLQADGHGTFTVRKQRGSYIQRLCDRHNKAKGASSGSPSKTRANGCTAYVSFSFEKGANITACVVRRELQHKGHSPQSPVEKRVSRIHPELVQYIEILAFSGRKTRDIIPLVAEWSKERGFVDIEDRRYYPSPKDIQGILYEYRKKDRQHSDDALSVNSTLKTSIIKHVIYYQPVSTLDNQALRIVVHTENQKKQFERYGNGTVFMASTYSGKAPDGFAIYALIVSDNFENGVPVCTFITSEDTEDSISACLHELKMASPSTLPSAFMIDKEVKYIGAIQKIYPTSRILICWFHVLQEINQWLCKKESGISGPDSYDERKKVLDFVAVLKNCATEEAFFRVVSESSQVIGSNIVRHYLEENWFKCASMWANFGRQLSDENSDANTWTERYFLQIKYQFLQSLSNRRLDDLLKLFTGPVEEYFSYSLGPKEAGGGVTKRARLDSGGHSPENTILQHEWGKKIIWASRFECSVPCLTQQDVQWDVNVLLQTCSCPAACREGQCKHIQLALLDYINRSGETIEDTRKKVAKECFKKKMFMHEESYILVLNEELGVNSAVQLPSLTCNCYAANHGIECVCFLTAAKVASQNVIIEIVTVPGCEATGTQPRKEQCSTVLSTSQMIQDLFCYSVSDQFEDSKELNEAVEKAYKAVFCR